jgi:exodeoxyribonuclease-3
MGRRKGFERAYVELAHAAVTKYRSFIRAAPTVMAGDFNSNTIFDGNRDDNHSRLVARLADLGLFSAYHAHHREAQGAETRPTYFHYRRRERPYHLDHVFLPEAWRAELRDVEVGSPDEWLAYSDHCPMTVTLRP